MLPLAVSSVIFSANTQMIAVLISRVVSSGCALAHSMVTRLCGALIEGDQVRIEGPEPKVPMTFIKVFRYFIMGILHTHS
ncbi:hypothetical protein C8R48DRAFT_708563 [Suillus tomentosus]|nr:hypothetical protein C8R48DRAFT_708563 [Suillus tomentosus]